MILLDSSILIHYLRGVVPVVHRLQQSSRRDLRIPSIVAYEIAFGAMKSRAGRRRSVVFDLLESIGQVPFDGPAAKEAARIRSDLEGRGLSIGPMDLLIAATALSRGATLVTSNTHEFKRIPHLRFADWTTGK